jgi:hypothetical protein
MPRIPKKQAEQLEPLSPNDTVYTIRVAGGVTLGRYVAPLAWTSGHWQWGELIDATYRDGNGITIPGDQFCDDRRVKDACRAVWQGGQIVDREARPYINAGGTVVILESSHKDEYTKDGTFEPLIPLNGTRSTQRFFQYLGAIFGAIERQGGTVPEGDVILCNPIQWQTSLHRITKANFLVSEIRDEVWSKVWSIGAVQAHFEARLKSYRPGLIINACTGHIEHGLKKTVQQTLDRLLAGGVLRCDCAATHHPSVWAERTPPATVLLRRVADVSGGEPAWSR